MRYIESCMVNVIEQGCPDAEHIIIDGNSSDGTVEIIKQYSGKYQHIRWISECDNGQSDAMNKGILMAKGEIIGILNVDDFYEPGALHRALALFKNLSEPSLLVGNCNMWDDGGKIWLINKPAHLDLIQLLTADESRFPFPVNPSAYFYHKSLHDVIGMYDINDHYLLDLDFIIRAATHRKPVYINQLFGNYRFIEGTKTFEDMKSGSGRKRFRKMIHKYRKKLPFEKRMEVFYSSTVAKFLYIVHRGLFDRTRIHHGYSKQGSP